MLSEDNIYQYPSDDDHTSYDKGRGKGFSEESYTDKHRHNRLKGPIIAVGVEPI